MRHVILGGVLMVMITVVVVADSGPACADSLWLRRELRNAYLFEDNRARRIGDLLTIQVNEITVANESDQRGLSKSASNEATLNYQGSTSAGANVSRSGQLKMDASNSSARKFDGSAEYKSNRTFTDTVTVQVIDVLPNGNIVVEGYRTRLVSGEMRTLRVTGIVRTSDIDTGNLVSSQLVANFRIAYVGKGPETNFTRQGYFDRWLNVLWPF